MAEMIGTVVGVAGRYARARVSTGSGCSTCASSCTDVGPMRVVLRAANPIGAGSGDRVRLTVGRGARTRAGFVLYVLPLVFFFVGFIAATALARVAGVALPEGLAVLSGFAFMALPWVVTYLRGRASGRTPVSITGRV